MAGPRLRPITSKINFVWYRRSSSYMDFGTWIKSRRCKLGIFITIGPTLFWIGIIYWLIQFSNFTCSTTINVWVKTKISWTIVWSTKKTILTLIMRITISSIFRTSITITESNSTIACSGTVNYRRGSILNFNLNSTILKYVLP